MSAPRPADEPQIAVAGLAKTYGRGAAACVALRGLDFTISAGEWVCIMGHSGSGKTTLLNVLGALDAHYDGSVRIEGHELKRLKDKALSRLRGRTVGFVFQQFNLLPHLSVTENVLVPGVFGGVHSDPRGRAHELLERVGLGDKLSARPQHLSGGQQQRVAIARALFNGGRILLCDEPTGALDREAGEVVLDLFASLNTDEGITLVVVTHEDYISQRAQRVLRLEDGRLAGATSGPALGAQNEKPAA